MQLPLSIPQNKRRCLEKLVTQLSQAEGIAAIALGGSYARGTAHAESDLDVALYYHEDVPFAIEDIRRIAAAVSVDGNPTVTDFYGWGHWVNGGAWIQTDAGKVDFLYRKIEQVEQTIDNAQHGIIERDYDQQPTHGFYSVIYLAETQVCIPLYDPLDVTAQLKEAVKIYPSALKQKIITGHLWSAEFTLIHARDFADKGDVYNTVGCLTRITGYLTQVLFALNEVYYMTDKLVMETVAEFPIKPSIYTQQVVELLSHPGSSVAELKNSVGKLALQWEKIKDLSR